MLLETKVVVTPKIDIIKNDTFQVATNAIEA